MVLILTHRPGSAWEAKAAPAHRGPFLRGRAPSCSQHPLTPAPQSAWSPAADFASVTQALLRALTQLLYVPQSSSGNLGSTTLPADSTCSYCSAAAQMDKEPVCLRSSLGDGTQTNLRGLFLSVRPPPCLLGPRWWAVMSAVSGRCWFSHRHYFSNWKIEASLSRYFPGTAWRWQGPRCAQGQLPPAAEIWGPPDPRQVLSPSTSPTPAPGGHHPSLPGPWTELLSPW